MGRIISMNKLNLPLQTPDKFYQLLLDNHVTKGTDEQKMLALRRRFDYLLRQVLGGFGKKDSFYYEGLNSIKKALGSKANETEWREFQNMRNEFNLLMHQDVDIDNQRYLLSLKRMASFVRMLTDTPIPPSICELLSDLPGFRGKVVKRFQVFCCIDRMAFTKYEERDAFNNAARSFKSDILGNDSLCQRVSFSFIVADNDSVYTRDLSDGPQKALFNTDYPREEATLYAIEKLRESRSGILIMMYGGTDLLKSESLEKSFSSLTNNVDVYPLVLASRTNPYSRLSLFSKSLRMLPDCYDEFFSWLYGSLVLYNS